MQFQGRIYKLFPVQSGTSQRGEWSRQDFIFEYFETANDRYADRVLLSVMNDRIREYDLHEGDEVIIGFGHTTREYQGRYFNDVRLYHFEKVKQVGKTETPTAASAAATAAAQPQQTVAPSQAQQPAAQPSLFPSGISGTNAATPADNGDDLPF
jgi:hypothetical protein